ncbi:TPA: hypothetical protein MB310_000090 [Klebsiella pneumoniae]|nr:hypothetical protein [Klebsiella pneumoniae]
MTILIEFIKYFTPILTFSAGIYAAPFIERRKEARVIKEKIKSIQNEISDEYKIIIKSIYSTDKSIKMRIGKPEGYKYLSLPMALNLRLTANNLDHVYAYVTEDKRKAFKVLLLCQKTITEYHNQIEGEYKNNNILCLAKEKAMLKSMLSAYYLLNALTTNWDTFSYPKNSNHEIWEIAAKSLNITMA